MSNQPMLNPESDEESSIAWYCVRSKPKAEHIAVAHLRLLDDVEVFCPRIRYHKATKRGKVKFTEAMFPGYIFARFDLKTMRSAVYYAHSVSGIVQFGGFHPRIPDDHVSLLKAEVGPEDVKFVETQLNPGDAVEITEGAFRGLKAIVQYYRPSAERVKVLLDILGGQNPVEVGVNDVVRPLKAEAV
ncbi:MAG: transcription termination/antitermination NusG family protein [Verrucomicrobiota bacterium]